MTSEKEKRITATHKRDGGYTIKQNAYDYNDVYDKSGKHIGRARNMEGSEAIVKHDRRNKEE